MSRFLLYYAKPTFHSIVVMFLFAMYSVTLQTWQEIFGVLFVGLAICGVMLIQGYFAELNALSKVAPRAASENRTCAVPDELSVQEPDNCLSQRDELPTCHTACRTGHHS